MRDPGEEDRAVDAASKIVKAEAFEMKRCLDKNKTMDALKHALNFLGELRTNELSPKYYYRLYMDSVNELQYLENYLVDEYERDSTKLANLYECVQYATTIVPRLYLLVTIGVAYIRCGIGSRHEILYDLVEMCRGVQHPLRGLFLRNYLLQTTRSHLPDLPAADRKARGVNVMKDPTAPLEDGALAENGNVMDALHFVLTNFAEMNKLWVRMQHQGLTKDKDRRERDRLELRILVGTNLVRLSNLDNITQDLYMREILPGILEQVVSCRDYISQDYLMECIIQVFPDEFHLASLNEFLQACGQLEPHVNVKNILIALIDRLALYSASDESKIPSDMKLFEIFSEQAKSLIGNRPEMPMEDIVALHVALVSLAVKCYASKMEYANTAFGSLRGIFDDQGVEGVALFSPVGRELSKLLRLAIDEYKNIIHVAELSQFAPVLNAFDYQGRCHNTGYIVQNMLDNETWITNETDLKAIANILDSLLRDQKDQPADASTSEDFVDEQQLLARLVHLIKAETPGEQYLLLNEARKLFGTGGKYRIKYTLPPVVFSIYHLIMSYGEKSTEEENWDAKAKKMFVGAMGTIGMLITTAELSELPLMLYLEGSIVADRTAFEDHATVVYEFFSKALSVLEDDISDSKTKISCLSMATASLLKLRSLSEENWEPLACQIVLAAAKLFKKPDQVRMLCTSSHIYWSGHTLESNGPLRKGSKVAEILRKAIKVSTQCIEDMVQQQLLLHILDFYLHFYENGCEELTSDMLAELIARIRTNSVNMTVSAEADAMEKQLANVVKHIEGNKEVARLAELASKLQV